MIELKNIDKSFSNNVETHQIFDDFSFKINQGDFICVLGSNGAGKSTLLNLIGGKIKPCNGIILLEDKDITSLDEYKRSQNITRIFQDVKLGTVEELTVFENLLMAENKNKRFNLSFMKNSKRKEFYKEKLKEFELNLEDKLETKVMSLSGGQRQCIAILMAKLMNPKVLLLDEHTAALDPKTSTKVMDITNEIIKEENLTSLMVTHNISHALDYGNRLIMMDKGKVIVDIDKKKTNNLTKEKLLALFKNPNDQTLFS